MSATAADASPLTNSDILNQSLFFPCLSFLIRKMNIHDSVFIKYVTQGSDEGQGQAGAGVKSFSFVSFFRFSFLSLFWFWFWSQSLTLEPRLVTTIPLPQAPELRSQPSEGAGLSPFQSSALISFLPTSHILFCRRL